MTYNGEQIVFSETKYVMNDQRAVLAFTADGEPYADVTICLGELQLPDGYVFFNADANPLVREMVRQGYVELHHEVQYNMGKYSVGKFTEKFESEVKK